MNRKLLCVIIICSILLGSCMRRSNITARTIIGASPQQVNCQVYPIYQPQQKGNYTELVSIHEATKEPSDRNIDEENNIPEIFNLSQQSTKGFGFELTTMPLDTPTLAAPIDSAELSTFAGTEILQQAENGFNLGIAALICSILVFSIIGAIVPIVLSSIGLNISKKAVIKMEDDPGKYSNEKIAYSAIKLNRIALILSISIGVLSLILISILVVFSISLFTF